MVCFEIKNNNNQIILLTFDTGIDKLISNISFPFYNEIGKLINFINLLFLLFMGSEFSLFFLLKKKVINYYMIAFDSGSIIISYLISDKIIYNHATN